MATTPATDAAEITSRILLETESVLFSPEQLQFAAVKALLDDPDGWSAARGGGRSSASS